MSSEFKEIYDELQEYLAVAFPELYRQLAECDRLCAEGVAIIAGWNND